MNNNEICTLSVFDLRSRLSNRDVSALEVAKAYLERIDQVDGAVKAWEALDIDYVLSQARVLDEKQAAGQSLGTLFGVPFGLKDIINTKVLPTHMGSPIWRDHHAGNDARVVAHLLWEDALILGKTVTAEFAVHSPNGTANPHCLTCTPGTSSSGSAAAVASGMIPAGVGTQTAGSLIRPASFCGVYGYKPTFGWLPRTGILKTTDTLDQVGFHTRDAFDLRLLFEAGRVRGRNYRYKERRLAEHPDKKQWRIGLVYTHLIEAAPEYAKQELESFAQTLRSAGVEVEEFELPEKFRQAHDIHRRIYDSDLAYYFRDEYTKNTDLVSPSLARIIQNGLALSPDDYRVALAEQVELSDMLESFFEDNRLDAVLTLASNGEAPRGEEPTPWQDSCLIWTMCGVPSITVPVFKGPNGLPFGAQLISHKYGDHVLLSLVEHLRSQDVIGAAEMASLISDIDDWKK